MKTRAGVVMDPISTITPYKDTTFAILLEAQRRGWEMRYMELPDLYVRDGRAFARHRPIRVWDRPPPFFELGEPHEGPLSALDVVFLRKDPPFNMEYIYATYILERAEAEGTLVVNRPQALRDANEKAFTSFFPEWTPPTLMTRDPLRLRRFAAEEGDIVVKPLDGMGGQSIFRVTEGDPNLSVILEVITGGGTRFAIAQRYIPQISDGDKRIIIIDGTPYDHALARIPAKGELRGNLAAGAKGIARPLSQRDRAIAEAVAPVLREKGLLLVGLDVIGDYLTEVNVTSPTGIRELDQAGATNLCARLLDAAQGRHPERTQ